MNRIKFLIGLVSEIISRLSKNDNSNMYMMNIRQFSGEGGATLSVTIVVLRFVG